jgi:small neutral amino acid transporter SnatA (MarC family)
VSAQALGETYTESLSLLVVLVTLLLAERLGPLLPASLISFLTRVLALLLSAIAVQLVVDGVRGLA